MNVKFTKDWRQHKVDDIADIDDKDAKSLIKFGYAKDASGTTGQDADNQTKAKVGKSSD